MKEECAFTKHAGAEWAFESKDEQTASAKGWRQKLHGRERDELREQQERGQIWGEQGYHARDLDTAQ